MSKLVRDLIVKLLPSESTTQLPQFEDPSTTRWPEPTEKHNFSFCSEPCTNRTLSWVTWVISQKGLRGSNTKELEPWRTSLIFSNLYAFKMKIEIHPRMLPPQVIAATPAPFGSRKSEENPRNRSKSGTSSSPWAVASSWARGTPFLGRPYFFTLHLSESSPRITKFNQFCLSIHKFSVHIC